MHSTALVVVFVSCTFGVVVSQASVNYCGSRMCGNTNAHTFCQYPEGPSPQCVGYISANLTNEEKSRVIARLNRRRNEAAAGRLRGFASAGNMLKLRWVEELAREAQRWADQCRPPEAPEEQDTCRDLYSVSVGQCVASVVGEAPGLRIESMVDIWYMQNILYKGNITSYMPPNSKSSFYGDFGQMMWAQSYMVGCGRSRFMTEVRGRLRSVERLVCNIAPRGPTPARPLWSPSAPATLCPSRSLPDTTFNALCDIQLDPTEIHEVDASMTLEEHFLLYTVLDIERNESLRYPGSLDELYLTRLAIATMDNFITTETYYNSIQKRDVVEMIELEEVKSDNNVSQTQNGVIALDINTLPPNSLIMLASTKKKMSLIGRPKPYNMEELTDMDYKIENYSPSEEETTRKQKEFYAEYEFVENTEENSTSKNTEGNVTLTNIIESMRRIYYDNKTSEEAIAEVTSEPVVRLDEYTSASYEELSSQTGLTTDNAYLLYNNSETGVSNTQIKGLLPNGSLVPINTLDYLSDQETVKELQEALEFMERGISTEYAKEHQGKVRRDLRDDIDRRPHLGDKMPEVNARNSTLNKSSMYNMVLQYMPYLRDYQSGILTKATGRATRVSSTAVVVLSVCLYF